MEPLSKRKTESRETRTDTGVARVESSAMAPVSDRGLRYRVPPETAAAAVGPRAKARGGGDRSLAKLSARFRAFRLFTATHEIEVSPSRAGSPVVRTSRQQRSI